MGSTAPDTELFNLIKRFQAGDSDAIWLFADNSKIKAIIKARIRQYRQMFHWLSDEDFEDIEFGLLPRIHDIAKAFALSEQPNDGRVISYFNLRLKGEADFLLKKITGMKLVVDEEQNKTFLKSITESAEGLEETIPIDSIFVDELVNEIEVARQDQLLHDLFENIPPESNDRIWLKCYLLRMKKKTWAEIGKEIGYKQTDHTWLKENTARFVTRLKHKLLQMGELVNFRVCGIYTDSSEVAIAILDSHDKKRNVIWSKTYHSFADLEKIEAKIGDILREADITYIMMNDMTYENHAHIIILKYLSKKESFVETVDLSRFKTLLPQMPESVNGIVSSDAHRNALLLAHIKRACVGRRS